MNFKTENIKRSKVAYMRQIGSYGNKNIIIMEQLKEWSKKNNILNNNSVIYGIAWDSPETTPSENCRYDVCIEVSDCFESLDNIVETGYLEGGKYVCFEVAHTSQEVQKAWMHIIENLKNEGLQFDLDRPIFERYKIDIVNNHLCELCVPIL